MNTVNVLGEFWIPSEPDHRATGILSFTPEEGASLALVREGTRSEGNSALWQSPDLSLSDAQDIPRIDGFGIYDMDKKEACAHYFTLENCMSMGTGLYSGLANSSTSIFHPEFIYDGNVEWGSGSELTFKSVSFTILGAEGWISSIIQTDFDYIWDDSDGESRISEKRLRVAINDSDEEQAYIDGIGNLTVSPNIAFHIKGFSHTINASIGFKIDFAQPCNFKEILKIAGRLRNLLKIATGEFHTFDSFYLTVPDLEDSSVAVYFREAFIDGQKDIQEKPLKKRYHDSKFRYEEIGRAKGISQWITKTIETTDIDWSLAISLITDPGKWRNTPIEFRLFSIMTGVLMLYPEDPSGKSTNEKREISRRLKRLIETINDIIPDYIDNEWADAVSDLRSKCIAHPESRRVIPFPESGDGSPLLVMLLLYRIGITYIMKIVLELPEDHIKKRVWNDFATQQILDRALIHDIKKWHKRVTQSRVLRL